MEPYFYRPEASLVSAFQIYALVSSIYSFEFADHRTLKVWTTLKALHNKTFEFPSCFFKTGRPNGNNSENDFAGVSYCLDKYLLFLSKNHL